MGKNMKHFSGRTLVLGLTRVGKTRLVGISFLFSLVPTVCNAGTSTTVKKSAYYDTTVVEDRGGQPIDKYLPKNDSKERSKKNYKHRQSTKLVHAHFPVITKSMSVGRVTDDEASEIKYQVATRPMFIIGYDPVSMKWLKDNRELLSEKGAIGLVVNVETNEQMEELQKLAGDKVMMQPTPGDNLAEHLKLKHYPFYMDSMGVLR